MSPSPSRNGLVMQPEETRICVVMVGLPARGKSFIAQKGLSSDELGRTHPSIAPFAAPYRADGTLLAGR